MLGCVKPALPQPYYFRHYQVEQGLSNNAVICSIQDRRGFMWFGTKDGLNRYDGYTFKTFRYRPDDSNSIGSNFIHALCEDPSGNMWVGTENGLYGYDTSTERFRLVASAPAGQIRAVQADKAGNLWFVSGFSLFKYTPASGRLQYYDISHYFESSSICLASDGNVWIATTNGFLERYDSYTDKFTPFDVFGHSHRTGSRWIEKIYATSDGQILVGTSNQGAKSFRIATGDYTDILTYNSDGTEIFVRAFLQTRDGEYWIATESGIFIYNGTSVVNLHKMYNDPYSISDNAVYTFCKDREGGIWVGTYFGGINYYPRQYTPFKKYFPRTGENSLGGNVVREIREDQYHNLWIGTEDAGLNKFNTATQTFTHYQPDGTATGLTYANIHGLLPRGNELWVGTFEHGLDVLDVRTGKVIRRYNAASGRSSLRSNFIYCIYQPPGGQLMLGTTIGAYKYDPLKDDFDSLPYLPLHCWYSSLLQDRGGTVWAATYGSGLYSYNGKTTNNGHGGGTTNYRYSRTDSTSLCSDRVNSIFEDSRGWLWLATEGGLCRFNNGRFIRYTTADGLPSNFILCLLEDKKGRLWISTSRGLVCLDPRDRAVKTFTQASGLLSDQFNFNSAYEDSAGTMYFGSARGFISFNSGHFTANQLASRVYITGFQVHNKELPIAAAGSPLRQSITSTTAITLPYNQSSFSIDFALLSYTAPEISEYAYRMEGLDKNWTELKTNRKAYFTELAPGTYTFKVKASNSDGVWDQKETRLTIAILPPWWRSWWAYLLYALVVGAIVRYIIYSYHVRTEEKNRRKMEMLEAAREKEIFKSKIEFFINVAHEIKTPLTLIKAPLEKVMRVAGGQDAIKDSLSIMHRNTNRLLDLTSQLLDFRQAELQGYSLNFVKANITALVGEMCQGFIPLAEQRGIAFAVALPPGPLYAYVDKDAFSKILSNLLSNAVKYAHSRVELTLVPQDATFTIAIANDGYIIPPEMKEKIFEPFFRLKETEKQKGAGIGLALSRSLASMHKGSLVLEAPAPGENGDRVSDRNTFILTIPIHQEIEFDL
ncbi:ligand-binding sensor domain-containing protein [Puia sp. P3]|uniref:ligand-binding sensor domain-containing protein n=1 Tax=Puia sp. P3 TaxID=3423952 RepID=UPI003D663C5F